MSEFKLQMGPIVDALGEDNVPQIDATPLGRYRLIQALQNKYGENFRNMPKASRAMEHFDSELSFAQKLRKIQGTGSGPTGGGYAKRS